jgi:hypothetical protein
MIIIRNRQARDRRKARNFRIERNITHTLGTIEQLIEANPPEGRYPGTGNGGAPKGDHSDPTYQAMLKPDPIQAALERIEDRQEIIDRLAAENVADLRIVQKPEHTPDRSNSVQVCAVCVGPCVPKAVSHAGQGPLCPACYRSCYDAVKQGTEPIVWRTGRMQRLAETG